MASDKTELNRHILYLEARRSGAEWCVDRVLGENNKANIRDFIQGLNVSIQENQAKVAVIVQEEQRKKNEEKAVKEAFHNKLQKGMFA